MSRPTFIIFFSQVVCLHESFRKSVKCCQTASGSRMKTNGAIWKKLWEQRERRIFRQACKSFPWVKQRQTRKSRWKYRSKWLDSVIKDLEAKSRPFKPGTNGMAFSALPGKPGSFQAVLFLIFWATDYCITSVQTSFLRCIFTSNSQNMSLKLQLWNCTWYMCL